MKIIKKQKSILEMIFLRDYSLHNYCKIIFLSRLFHKKSAILTIFSFHQEKAELSKWRDVQSPPPQLLKNNELLKLDFKHLIKIKRAFKKYKIHFFFLLTPYNSFFYLTVKIFTLENSAAASLFFSDLLLFRATLEK